MRIKENWLALAFIAALVLITVLALISGGPGWCHEQETALSCAREWVNATGSLFTVIAAVAAALFAYRQFQAAHTQNRLTRLNAIEDQLSAIFDLNGIASTADSSSFLCARSLSALADELRSAEPQPVMIRAHCQMIVDAIIKLDRIPEQGRELLKKFPYNKFAGDIAAEFYIVEFRMIFPMHVREVYEKIASTERHYNAYILQLAQDLLPHLIEVEKEANEMEELHKEIRALRNRVSGEQGRLHSLREQALASD